MKEQLLQTHCGASGDMRVLLVLLLLWTLGLGSTTPPQDVDILRLTQQSTWKSDPEKEYVILKMELGAMGLVPVLQACASSVRRSVLSEWTERGEAKHLYMDITFAQEQEPQPAPLQVHLLDHRFPSTHTSERWKVLELNVSQQFPLTTPMRELPGYFIPHVGLPLGVVRMAGFQLGLSFSGTCVLVSALRVFYRRCPHIELDLSSFAAAAGGSAVRGSCVRGAVEVEGPLERTCSEGGVWGPQQGQCVCAAGHQPAADSCQACGIGFYRWANESGGCQKCPPHSQTLRLGSDWCECEEGFSRLPSDPHDLGCAQPPSAPVKLNVDHFDDSVLILTWDPPLDHGGRSEMSYHVQCETRGQYGDQWKSCEGVLYLMDPDPTSVKLTGLEPYQDYRLSVQAQNDISKVQGAPSSSTASVIIHRWKAPPVVTVSATHTPGVEARVTSQSLQQRGHYVWVSVGVLFGVLFLLVVIQVSVCIRQRKHYTLRPEQCLELSPIHPGVSYRRPQDTEVTPDPAPQAESVMQLLEGLGVGHAASLRDVLVDRRQLTLGKQLGKGEFGAVYEALFTRADGESRKVAVKTMRVGFHRQEELHEFLREAEIMKNFDHDNVVQLLGVTLQQEADSSVPLFILPFMKHGDLRRFLIASRYGDIPMFVPYQTLLRFMVDIASGMDYLSSLGFLHRDLAARNCMLGNDLRVCVADFGLSRKIYDNNYYRQKEVIRVPIKWMAMESLSESVYTTKSDVWSFGVTMWEIISRGRTPYPGVYNYELLDLLLTGYRLKPPEDCDSKIWEVMQSCWEKQPTQRPGFRELCDRLKTLQSELPAPEACQEATYINQGLEAAAAADSLTPHNNSRESTKENDYLPSPVGAGAVPPPLEEDNGTGV